MLLGDVFEVSREGGGGNKLVRRSLSKAKLEGKSVEGQRSAIGCFRLTEFWGGGNAWLM